METSTLKGPPALLERIVLLLIPPAAREVVAGDLWERYRSPRQYAIEALSALPFVIASQARRNVNLPVVGLQGFLAFGCFGGFTTPFDGVAPTLTIVAALLLQAAYQGLKPPSASRAAMETVLAAGAILIILVAHSSVLRTEVGAGLWTIVVVGSLPVLSLFRAKLALANDRQGLIPDHEMTTEDIRRDYGCFAGNMTIRNQIATCALVLVAATAVLICRYLSPTLVATGWGLASIYMAGGIYLLLTGAARALPAEADFLSLRAIYGHELARQNQLRCFIWWLWLTPLLSETYVRLIGRGMAADQPLLLAYGILTAILLCFLVITINSERNGRIQESIVHLARMRERSS